MKILVNFKSGFKQTFIVPKGMLTVDFRNMAREIGGNIESIEFSLPSSRQQNQQIPGLDSVKALFACLIKVNYK